MWKVLFQSHPRFGTWYARIERQPNWVIRLAILAMVLVVVVPLVLITLAALLVGFIVFVTLGAIALMVRFVTAVLTAPFRARNPVLMDNGGRVNVRVIQREP